MTDPPLNESPEAVRVRKAATVFGRQIDDPTDDHDLAGQRRNKELLTAALAYANAVFHAQPVYKHETPKPRRKHVDSYPQGPAPTGAEPVRWQCVICDRHLARRAPHKCLGRYRRHNLKWRPIYPDLETLPK